jgi:hypothetical protein
MLDDGRYIQEINLAGTTQLGGELTELVTCS